ncbi:MAG: hypothetical protein DRO12_04200 [Thermoprotei archaeon]|nr:MAG: hypothetical protein DRO12_04200 [Thermoprotei archaeon]
MSGIDEIIRFVPLPHTLPPPPQRVFGNISHEVTVLTFESRKAVQLQAMPDLTSILGLVVATLFAVYILLVISTSIHVERAGKGTAVVYGKQQEEEKKWGELGYAYVGIEKTLRKLYLFLRERYSCVRCTPRELVAVSRGALALFAEVYEKIVYGKRSPDEVPELRKVLES